MTNNSAEQALEHAAALGQQSRTAARWLIPYYLVFGTASLAMAIAVGLTAGRPSMIWIMGLWALVIAGLTLYSSTRKAALRGMGKLHGTLIGIWASIWAVTVALGSTGDGSLGFMIAGGLAMFAVCVGGAVIVHQRTRAGVAS